MISPLAKRSPIGQGWGVVERQTGDGFMRCSDGHVRWGVYGAAGVVFVVHDTHGSPLVMLQKRSAMAHEGGNWSCAGGALDLGETAFEGALREASEEVGLHQVFPDCSDSSCSNRRPTGSTRRSWSRSMRCSVRRSTSRPTRSDGSHPIRSNSSPAFRLRRCLAPPPRHHRNTARRGGLTPPLVLVASRDGNAHRQRHVPPRLP